MSTARSNLNSTDGSAQNWQEIVREHVASLHYGTVEIIVHDSQVIQIEKTERLRLGKTNASAGSDTVKIAINPDNRFPKKQ